MPLPKASTIFDRKNARMGHPYHTVQGWEWREGKKAKESPASSVIEPAGRVRSGVFGFQQFERLVQRLVALGGRRLLIFFLDG